MISDLFSQKESTNISTEGKKEVEKRADFVDVWGAFEVTQQ